MALFQKSVLNKYLDGLDQTKVDAAYQKFSAKFHDPAFQLNIRKAKEEQYQEGFLNDLFVNVLGYIKNPEPNYNLTTEFKNIKNSKKADGAILVKGKAIAVIELKGMNTPNLDKVEAQAFGYKSNQPDAVYVITANFEKLRFYIDNAVDFIEWNLFNLTKEQFKEVWLCLAQESILSGLPKQIKEESIIVEKTVTERLYKDYSAFRRELFNSIEKKNPDIDPLLLFKKTQKLLDRFLFIFFAEDRLLVPPNSINQIIAKWKDDNDFGDEKPLYDIFKQYFKVLNTGRPARGKRAEIFAYNGGLFQPDDLLDRLKIDDFILYKHTGKLTTYDFVSEVDVNILGHIFEHSLNDIEEMNAQLNGESLDKSKSKRKKDGVFYTPKYITKYIVENTVGKLCTEKKTELGIVDIDFSKTYMTKRKRTTQDGKKTFLSVEGENIYNSLNQYRDYLLNLTICDPACGSGAFLNQAFNFLIDEHENIDQYHASLRGDTMTLTDVTKDILEYNLFGVDINEEAVEIAKLSLWLRTAQKGRKLNSLNENIKCGNSVIDNPEVAKEKAFIWEKEFPEVFKNGGFDIVIGNPPYVRQELIKEYSKELSTKYKSFSGKADLFVYFYEKGIDLLKEKGILSFISSGKFFEASYGYPLINHLVKNVKILEVINYKDLEVFEGISAYPLILSFSKEIENNYDFNFVDVTKLDFEDLIQATENLIFEEINIENFIKNDFQFINKKISLLLDNVKRDSTSLEKLSCLPLVGVKTGYNDGYITNNPKEEFIKGYTFGKNLKRYNPVLPPSNIIFPYQFKETSYALIDIDSTPDLKELLIEHRIRLEKRAIIKEGIISGNKTWFEYQQIKKNLYFDNEYIVYPNVSLGNNFTLSKGNVIDMTGFIIPSNDKGLLAVLNSNLVKFLMEIWAISRRGGYLEYKVQYLNKIPIKLFVGDTKQEIVKLVESIIKEFAKHLKLKNTFLRLLQRKFQIEKSSKNLQNWHTLTYADFVKELKKKKIKLGLAEEAEWEDYFEAEKAKAQAIQAVIDKTDREIDQMVYELYGLTTEEIQIVENS